MSYLLAPSILSADMSHLGDAVIMLDKSQADWVHVDVMDGVFVPNLTFGFPIIKAIRPLTTKLFDVHLMMVQPERYIKEFKKAGADILTVQYEACTHLHRTIQEIKNAGMQAGVAINPHTPAIMLQDVLQDLDLVLVMSVNPGFGGQSFIPQSLLKIRSIKKMMAACGSHAVIEVDGGVNRDNLVQIVEAGADVIVAGNAIFSTSRPIDTIAELKAMK